MTSIWTPDAALYRTSEPTKAQWWMRQLREQATSGLQGSKISGPRPTLQTKTPNDCNNTMEMCAGPPVKPAPPHKGKKEPKRSRY